MLRSTPVQWLSSRVYGRAQSRSCMRCGRVQLCAKSKVQPGVSGASQQIQECPAGCDGGWWERASNIFGCNLPAAIPDRGLLETVLNIVAQLCDTAPPLLPTAHLSAVVSLEKAPGDGGRGTVRVRLLQATCRAKCRATCRATCRAMCRAECRAMCRAMCRTVLQAMFRAMFRALMHLVFQAMFSRDVSGGVPGAHVSGDPAPTTPCRLPARSLGPRSPSGGVW